LGNFFEKIIILNILIFFKIIRQNLKSF
jgi:hypothetical protein